MKAIYGTSFLTIYGEVPHPIWIAEIEKLTDKQARSGLTRLAREQREFPANLTEYLAACRGTQSPRFLGVPQSPESCRRRLPRIRASDEQVDSHLASIRTKLKAAKLPTRKVFEATVSRPAGCTCQSEGTCGVCIGYASLYQPIPREHADADQACVAEMMEV